MDSKKKTVLSAKDIKRLDVLGARILQKPKDLKRHSQRLGPAKSLLRKKILHLFIRNEAMSSSSIYLLKRTKASLTR